MIFGADIDHDTNIKEGYLMCEYDEKNIYTEDGDLDTDETIRFFAHFPDYICEENGWEDSPLVMDIELDTDCIWEMYQENKESINETVGREEDHKFPTTVEDVFNIAYDVNAYMGLDS